MLDAINRERRDIEAGMREQAEAQLALRCWPSATQRRPRWCCSTPSFHEGVVGIVAGRVKDRWHRPTFVFARGADGLLKGSGRSIAGFHLRDALDLVAKRHPGVLLRFGGHAMAAGCTLQPRQPRRPSTHALQQVAARMARRRRRWRARLRTDGALAPSSSTCRPVRTLHRRSGARASRRRSSATRSRCCSSAWWARST